MRLQPGQPAERLHRRLRAGGAPALGRERRDERARLLGELQRHDRRAAYVVPGVRDTLARVQLLLPAVRDAQPPVLRAAHGEPPYACYTTDTNDKTCDYIPALWGTLTGPTVAGPLYTFPNPLEYLEGV